MQITPEQLDHLGRLADTANGLAGATRSSIGYRLEQMSRDLQGLYVTISGHNPWKPSHTDALDQLLEAGFRITFDTYTNYTLITVTKPGWRLLGPNNVRTDRFDGRGDTKEAAINQFVAWLHSTEQEPATP